MSTPSITCHKEMSRYFGIFKNSNPYSASVDRCRKQSTNVDIRKSDGFQSLFTFRFFRHFSYMGVVNNTSNFQICSRNHLSNTFHFSIAFDFMFRVSKQEIKSDGKVKSDFIDSWIKKQNLVGFPSLFGRHFSYMGGVIPDRKYLRFWLRAHRKIEQPLFIP